MITAFTSFTHADTDTAIVKSSGVKIMYVFILLAFLSVAWCVLNVMKLFNRIDISLFSLLEEPILLFCSRAFKQDLNECLFKLFLIE